MPGGTSELKEVTEEVRSIISALQNDAEALAHHQGWNGVVQSFDPVNYKTQVVAGTNYFVDVAVSNDVHFHLRVFRPLPHTGLPAKLSALRIAKPGDEVGYFEPA